jgi:histidine phosphotransferase ChpT
MFDVKVAELMASRICHDLVSPVGAINNGVELIEELGGDMADDALSLVGQSSRRAAAVLQLFRLAYGGAGAQENLGLGKARETAAAYFAEAKVALDWQVAAAENGRHMPPGVVKLLVNLVVLAEETLTHGGTVAVSVDDAASPRRLVVAADGEGAALSPAASEALTGSVPSDRLTARTIHAHVTGAFGRHYGLPLSLRSDGSRTVKFFLDFPD